MTRMSDARSKRRFEVKERNRQREALAVTLPFSVAFSGDGKAYRVGLFFGDDEPSDDNLVASMPVRGELTSERREDIVCKFMTLAAACITTAGEAAQVFETGTGSVKRVHGPREPEDKRESGENRGAAKSDPKPSLWSGILGREAPTVGPHGAERRGLGKKE